jgi:hypothetical protein
MSDENPDISQGRARRAANLFDLRRVIGALFVAYGLLLAILGLFDSDAEIDRAAGVNINLYGGLAMLAFAVGLFLQMPNDIRPTPELIPDPEVIDVEPA